MSLSRGFGRLKPVKSSAEVVFTSSAISKGSGIIFGVLRTDLGFILDLFCVIYSFLVKSVVLLTVLEYLLRGVPLW